MDQKKQIILEFLALPKEKQLQFLNDTNIADIQIKRYKGTNKLRKAQRTERLRRAQNPIHSNFEQLIQNFDINLETGLVTIKDAPERKPSKTNQGYLLYVFKGRSYLCHRLVMMKANNCFIEKGWEVDHINTKVDDNRWENLRLVKPDANKALWQNVKSGDFHKAEEKTPRTKK